MWNRLWGIVCGSIFGIALTVTANASESRTTAFVLPCDGQAKQINFTATGLGAAATRFIQSAEISLFQNQGGLQFILLNANLNPNAVIAQMGLTDNHVSNQFTGFYSVPNNLGVIPFTITGLCSGGGQIQGFVTIGFFS